MNFCTLFDSYYLLKGLGLYLSLEKVTDDFHLYVMAFDKNSYEKLRSCGFKHMTVELLDDFETPELLEAKKDRTKAEYCWTCGPSVIYHFLTKYGLDEITYLDSDLFFMADPHLIKEEAKNSSVIITEQGISEESAVRYGRYCVQYMTFKNDEDGMGALTWWRDRCIEWCYQIMEPTRYADQKYIDEFPRRWKDVCVLENKGAGIAPWNIHRYQYKMNTLICEGKEYPLIFYHFHGVKMEVKNDVLNVQGLHFKLGRDVIQLFYNPYAEVLMVALNKYLGQHVNRYVVKDISLFKVVEYAIRAWVKKQEWLSNFYFNHFHKRIERGHGSLVQEKK